MQLFVNPMLQLGFIIKATASPGHLDEFLDKKLSLFKNSLFQMAVIGSKIDGRTGQKWCILINVSSIFEREGDIK